MMAKLDEGRVHLIISILLGTLAVLTAVGAGIAIRMRLFGTGETGPAPSAPAAASSSVTPSLPPEPASSVPEEPASSRPSEPASSQTSSMPASSQEERSEPETPPEENPAYDPDFPGVNVLLFADGQTLGLTPEQVDEFMQLYLLVDIVYVRSEDNTQLNEISTGGFAVTYPDGRQEAYWIGEIYDGTWWSGNDFYEVDGHALALEEYLYQYPIIQNWLNRAHEAGLIIF